MTTTTTGISVRKRKVVAAVNAAATAAAATHEVHQEVLQRCKDARYGDAGDPADRNGAALKRRHSCSEAVRVRVLAMKVLQKAERTAFPTDTSIGKAFGIAVSGMRLNEVKIPQDTLRHAVALYREHEKE